MSTNGKLTTSKNTVSAKRHSLPAKSETRSEIQVELNRCRAELVCLRAKFNVDEVAKNRITEWSTEKMFQESLISAENELKKYQDFSGNSLRDLSKENSDLKKTAKYDQEEITVLKNRCKSLDTQCARLRSENEDLKRHQHDSKLNESSIEEIKQLRETLKEKEEQIVKHLVDNQSRGSQQAEYDRLQQKLNYERSQRQKLEAKLLEKSDELIDLESERQKLEAEVLQRKGEGDLYYVETATIEQLKSERDGKEAEIKQLREEMNTISAKYEQLKATTDVKQVTEDALTDTQSQLKLAEEKLSKQRIERSQEENKLRKLIDDNQSIIEASHEEIERLKELVKRSQLEKENLRMELDKSQLDVKTIVAENSTIKSKIQDLSSQNIDLSPEIKELKEKYEKEKISHARTKSQKEELEIRCHDAFEKINQKEKLLKTKDDQYKELIDRKDKTIAELRRERTMVNPTGNNNSKEVQAMKEKLEYAMKEMKAIKDEYELLKKLRD